MNHQKIEILLVEDNPGDVELTRQALDDADFNNKLNVTLDGDEALDYLNKRKGFEDAKMPDIILLDLNLPRTDGRGVLKELKASDELKHIPVIVLSSSRAERDINDAYALNASCYIAKPNGAMKYMEVVRTVSSFWSQTCYLPVK
ncbi:MULTISPECIES: response regulator [unclassified Lentilitoribacter]|uniref:response regulator n=1 Tax=unclassified Lentilitoribacter TaxID=2647570 RepID=UPI0013A6CCF3|nr:response regulator [Lentilitoribacter sp. Alg239-R112]